MKPSTQEPSIVPGLVELRASSLGKTFADHLVLADVALEVRRGEIVAVVGTSGCGKTVLLHMLLGLIPPTRGLVEVADHELPDAPLIDLVHAKQDTVYEVRLSWAVVFQQPVRVPAPAANLSGRGRWARSRCAARIRWCCPAPSR